LPTKNKIPYLTDTVKKLTLINILIFFSVLILFNIILLTSITYVLHQNLDQRIKHEIEKIAKGLSIRDSTITIIDSTEFDENDFKYVTDNPYFLQIFNEEGKILLTSENVKSYKNIPFDKNISYDNFYFESFSFNNESFRAGYYPLLNKENKKVVTIQLAVFERDYVTIVLKVMYFNLWSLPLIILIVILSSIFAAKKAFAPINKIIDTANSFNVQNLNQRIDVAAKPVDEIGRLRDTLNGLFNRIEEYVVEITNFSDQVSHQLMNPLTAIRTEIEYLLKKDRPENEYKEALVKLEGQTDSMISIVKTLLVIAKSGKIKSESKSVFNLSKLIKNDINNYFKNYNIVYEIEDNLYLRGESEKYLMVIQNLIHNAIKYSSDLLDVKVAVKKINKEIIITVEDKGIGIEESEKEFVFQKFYRSSEAEKLGIKGFGLGLSLVKSIVDEASGKVEILNNKPTGTIFKVTFPSIDLSD